MISAVNARRASVLHWRGDDYRLVPMMARKPIDAGKLTFPLAAARETRRVAAAGRDGKPYRFVVVRADGSLWEGKEGLPGRGLYMQRAAAARHAAATTGLIFNVDDDRIEIVGEGKWPKRSKSF